MYFSFRSAPKARAFCDTIRSMKSIFFVDGFNLYHAICDAFDHAKYKWLNLKQLALNLIDHEDELRSVHYFTAYCGWNKQKERKHRTYVEALTKYGVQTVEGKFMPVGKRFKKRYMRIFDMAPYILEDWMIPEEIAYVTNEEKRTDVNNNYFPALSTINRTASFMLMGIIRISGYLF